MTDHPLSRASSGAAPDPVPQGGAPAHHFEADPVHFREEEEESLNVRRYLAALARYKWLILAAALLGGGGAYLSWGTVESDYIVHGALWVNSDRADGQGPIMTEGLLPAQSWVDLLRSFSVMNPVVMKERLFVTPGRRGDLDLFSSFEIGDDLVPGPYSLEVSEDGRRMTLYRDRAPVDRGAPGATIGTPSGFLWTPPAAELTPGRTVPFTLMSPGQAARLLQSQLQARMDPQGQFIRTELRGPEPRRLVAVMDGLMERHVELAAELKRAHLDEQTDVLAQQLEQQERELADAERALEAFRVQTITLPSEGQRAFEPGLEMTRGPVFDAFFQMRLEQERLQRDRQRLENVLATLPDSDFPLESIEQMPVVASSSELQNTIAALVQARGERRSLLERYTENYPGVQEITERIQGLEQNTLPTLLRQLVGQLEQDERSLAARIDESGAGLTEIPPRTIEEGRLRRNVAIANTLYTELRSRYETASLARQSSIPDVRILDRATVQEVPANDLRIRLALLILFGSLGLGVAAALILDRVDSRVRTPDEVQGDIGLRVLGTVPRIRSTNGKKSLQERRQVQEAFRSLRTNLTYAYGAAGPLVVTVSSTGMGEGKTLVSANLAMAFAELGRKTLIIDADTRRGDLHERLGCRRKPGLTDFLRSEATWNEVAQETDHPKLAFVGSGTQVADSPELLSSSRFGRMFAGLRKHFDVIIVDSPPFGAGADPLVLSCITGHLLLVVRSGTTHREFMLSKLEPLERLPLRLLGAVLNDFEPERMSAYHQRYYGTYLPGYEAGAEEPEGREPEDRETDNRLHERESEDGEPDEREPGAVPPALGPVTS